MDKNNQNKSSNENYLQILLERIGSLSDSKVLTIKENKLKKLGLEDYTVCGAVWTSDGHPISNGLFNGDEAHFIIKQIDTILKAAIVNADQRNAVGALIENVIRERQSQMSGWTFNRIQQIQSEPETGLGDEGIIVESKSY